MLVIELYSKEMPRIQAMESMAQSEAVLMGQGELKKAARRKIADRWMKAARSKGNRNRVRSVADIAAGMAAMGMPVMEAN